MVQSKATTVKQYLDELPPERRREIAKVRSVVRKNLPKGYREAMGWGAICYEVPLDRYADTDNKKPYLLGAYGDPKQRKRLEDAFRKSGKKMDMGKSCLHFRSADDLPLDATGEIIASTPPEKMIEIYEAARPKKR